MKLGAMVAVSSFALSQVAVGQAVEWKVSDGGNGHWYFASATRMTYPQAKSWTEAHGGHLGTITSAGENTFVFDLARSTPGAWIQSGTQFTNGPFFGAEQPSNSVEPSGGWRWVTGELVFGGYTNFCSGQPDNYAGDQRVLSFWFTQQQQPSACWDDFFSAAQYESLIWTFIAEWSADCNNDGIVDYGQCRDGSLPDYNGNNIPDCCERGTTCVVGDNPVQWLTEEGGNGHWYAMRPNNPGGGFNAVHAAAISEGGDLASVQSASESAIIVRLLRGSGLSYWLGGYQPPEASEPSGGWAWTDGVTWSYTNWIPGEPNDTAAAEDYLAANPDGRWNDGSESAVFSRYALEWSADCNSDGIVDYGQILRGQLADVDANGVPDVCEYYEVPSEFATIQAAIDAVPAGQYGLVLVAAGTRNESFSLNGKNVRVQGAANNATILDGTGLTTSIARFTGGEPATAGLANLVFRNGTAGSRIYPKAPFTVGGAVYGINAAASITNCRFEQNRANYGGAVYLLYSSMAVDNCDFAGNTAIDEGGGVLVYETTGALTSCDFTQNVCGLSGPGSGSGFKSVGARVAGETVLLSGCTFTGGIAGVDGSAVEHFENTANVRGKLRMVGCTVTGNSSGIDAAGLRMTGAQASCVLAGGTTVCSNTPRNVDGPFLIEGSATVCGCMADVTGDGAVNGGDLGVVLSSWGGADASGTGDVNHDGVVNGSDLAIVLSSWGACGG